MLILKRANGYSYVKYSPDWNILSKFDRVLTLSAENDYYRIREKK